jgi:O-antigen ligase
MEFNNDQERTSAVTHLLDLIVLCTCIQILFGILVYYFPYTGNWFKFFYNVAGDTGLQSEINSDNIVRLRTFSLPAEAVGEFSAMLIPYALYRLTSSNNPPYILGTHILLIGVILSGTRSGAVLSLIGIILFYTFVEKNIRIKLSHISYAIVIFSILIIFNIGSTGIITRFGYAYNAYISGSDIGTILNRKFLFEGNWIFFKKTLSLFGNGLISPVSAGFLQLDFHNIYLTIIYQFGIIGAFFYFMLPLSLLLSLFKTLQKHQLQRKLTKVLILSLFIFLINETKFEFTRKHEYISIIWTLFSIFYLHTKQFSKRENCLRDLKNASPYTHTL